MATPRTSVKIRSENKVWQILELYILGTVFYNQEERTYYFPFSGSVL